MKGSCEIKIISISKPKFVFHKCANSVRKLHISLGGQTGTIKKKKGGGGGRGGGGGGGGGWRA